MKWQLFILSFFSLSIVHCQSSINQGWKLEQCIDSALVNNYNIRSANIKYDISSITLKNSKYTYLPSINGGATHGYNWGQTIDPFTNQFATNRVQYNNFYLSSSLVLFSGLQNYYTNKVAGLDLQSQAYNKQIEERNLKIQIATAYLQILLNNDIYEVLQEQLKLTLIQKERISNLIEAEREPQHKLLEILAQEETDKYNILKAQNDLNYSLLLLQQIMNMPYQPNFNVITFDTLANKTHNNEIDKKLDLSSFPEMKLSDLQIQKQELNTQIAKGRLSPSLSANGSIGSGYSGNNTYLTPNGELQPKPFNTQLNENFYQSLSFTLTIPIFNKNTTKTQIEISKLELEQLKLDKQKQALEIQNKIEQLKMDVSNFKAQLNSLKAVVNANQMNFDNAQIQFKNGYITYNELLEIRNKLFKSQSDLLQIKYSMYSKTLILSFYEVN